MFLRIFHLALVSAVVAALLVASAWGSDRLAGPYSGSVEHVIDGDTLAVRVTTWLDQETRVLVRVRGIDAPELRGACEGEKARAAAAATAVGELVATGAVVLTDIEGDKYHGRVVADVSSPAIADLGKALVDAGLARPYSGGRRTSWCAKGERKRATEENVSNLGAE